MNQHPIILGMSGASGAAYGLRLLQCLLQAGWPVYLLLSDAARLVVNTETALHLPADAPATQQLLSAHYQCAAGQLQVYAQSDWMAPVASGSALLSAMVVCPCSTGTLAAIANGNSDTLLERAADVALKERRKLLLVVRETPLSVLHLENMLRVARAGAVVMPACPGFYQRPESVAAIVDFMVARILDHLAIPHTLLQRWGADASQADERPT